MKKIIYLFFAALLTSNVINAQCVPNTSLTVTGFYPSTLPDAVVGQAYSQVVQFKIPTDTTILGYTAVITSAQLASLTGLPSGFSYACSILNCTYSGGAVGCLTITGTAQNNQIGAYTLSAGLVLTGSVSSGPLQGSHSVNFDAPISLDVVASNGVVVNQGPAFSYVKKENEILFNNLASGKLNVKIYDVLGSEVRNMNYQIVKGESTSINTSTLESGIYIVTFQLNGKQETFKISKGLY